MSFFKKHKKIIQIVALLLLFILVSIAIAQIPTDDLIYWIGSENAWLIMFILGAIGGLSTFVTIPYQVVLMSLASGGINPIILGVSTALGVMLGDSTMFLISKHIRGKLSVDQKEYLQGWAQVLEKHPKLITPILIVYGCISPFSNDFIVATLSMMDYRYLRIIVPLTIGNIFYNIGLAYIGIYAYSSFSGLW